MGVIYNHIICYNYWYKQLLTDTKCAHLPNTVNFRNYQKTVDILNSVKIFLICGTHHLKISFLAPINWTIVDFKPKISVMFYELQYGFLIKIGSHHLPALIGFISYIRWKRTWFLEFRIIGAKNRWWCILSKIS